MLVEEGEELDDILVLATVEVPAFDALLRDPVDEDTAEELEDGTEADAAVPPAAAVVDDEDDTGTATRTIFPFFFTILIFIFFFFF